MLQLQATHRPVRAGFRRPAPYYLLDEGLDSRPGRSVGSRTMNGADPEHDRAASFGAILSTYLERRAGLMMGLHTGTRLLLSTLGIARIHDGQSSATPLPSSCTGKTQRQQPRCRCERCQVFCSCSPLRVGRPLRLGRRPLGRSRTPDMPADQSCSGSPADSPRRSCPYSRRRRSTA